MVVKVQTSQAVAPPKVKSQAELPLEKGTSSYTESLQYISILQIDKVKLEWVQMCMQWGILEG